MKYKVIVHQKIIETWHVEAESQEEAETLALDGPHGVNATCISQDDSDVWVHSIDELHDYKREKEHE